jgi:hypothetical protein
MHLRLRWMMVAVLMGPAAFPDTVAAGGSDPAIVWTSTIQTGLADTFQLTLGGVFGRGPAWQTRLESGAGNLWKSGDSVYIYGTESLDSRSRRSEWQVGLEYRRPLWRRRQHALTGTAGFQHWKFSTVKGGANDYLAHENLTYRTAAGRVNFTVTSDSWSLLRTTIAPGTLLHTQYWVEHPLWKNDAVAIAFRHGPANTYSWGFYGTNGHRVVRYQTMLAITGGGFRIEAGYRKQYRMQPGIPENPFWQFSISRTVAHHR